MRYFLDTEFNGHGGELISLALVSENGRELYAAAFPGCVPVPWVAENVLPIVRCTSAMPVLCMRERIGGIIAAFLKDDSHPTIIADWPDDISYFCKTLITAPGQMVDIPYLAFEIIRVDAYPTDLPGAIQHNALWDARALRHKIMSKL